MRTFVLSITFLLAAIPPVRAATVAGQRFPKTVEVEGETLKLVGAGLREKWFFDVYALGAYSKSGACDGRTIVTADEPKYMRLVMLRTVSADKMASTISEAFAAHMPKDAPAELKQQRKRFEGYFKDELNQGQVLEFVYLPGTGTKVKQNGKELGAPLEGELFANVLWDIYFGIDTCCPDLKEAVLEGCGGKK